MDLGNFFLQERLKINFTQRKVSQSVGISHSYLSLIEQNKTNPPLLTIDKLCKFYKKPMWLVFLTEIDVENDILEDDRRKFLNLKLRIVDFYNEFYR